MTDNFSIGKEISAAFKAVKGWLSTMFADEAEPAPERASPRLAEVFNAVTGGTIATERLELRPLENCSDESIADFLNRDGGAFTSYYYDRPPGENHEPYAAEDVRAYMRDALNRNGTFLHPVAVKGMDDIIGAMGWWEDDFGRPRLTYFFLPSARARGYAIEAYTAELKEFARHGVATELIAQVAPENHASQNLLLKAGFHSAGPMIADSGVLKGSEAVLFRRDLSDLLPPPTVH